MKRLIEDIFASQMNEIQCDEATILIARCAAARLTDEEAQQQYPQLWRHFRFCVNCAGDYEMTMDLARLAATEAWQQPAHIPSPPDEKRGSIWSWAREAILAPFPGFAAGAAAALTRGVDIGLEPVFVTLDPAGLDLELEVTGNEETAGRRDLFCTFMAAETDLEAAFEGSSVWLLQGDAGPALQEQVLDELGDVTFSHISPGAYSLRLHLAGREYGLTGIIVP